MLPHGASRGQLQRGQQRLREGTLLRPGLSLRPEIRCSRLEPVVISCGAAISACEKGTLLRSGLGLIPEMGCSRMEPVVISFTISATISAGDKARQWQHALGMFEEISKQGAQADESA